VRSPSPSRDLKEIHRLLSTAEYHTRTTRRITQHQSESAAFSASDLDGVYKSGHSRTYISRLFHDIGREEKDAGLPRNVACRISGTVARETGMFVLLDDRVVYTRVIESLVTMRMQRNMSMLYWPNALGSSKIHWLMSSRYVVGCRELIIIRSPFSDSTNPSQSKPKGRRVPNRYGAKGTLKCQLCTTSKRPVSPRTAGVINIRSVSFRQTLASSAAVVMKKAEHVLALYLLSFVRCQYL
jgi:hypothetical protein